MPTPEDRPASEAALRLLVGPVAAAILILPWGLRPSGIPGDQRIHRMVVEGWLDSWRGGVAWPSYLDEVNVGMGSPWPLYYPPLYHAAVAGAMRCGLDYWTSAALVVAVASAAGGYAAFGWFRRHAGRGAASLGTLAVVAAPTLLFSVYRRGAYPEAFAMAWLPLPLSAIDRMSRGWSWGSLLSGAVGFGLISLGNHPALVVSGVGCGLLACTAGLTGRSLLSAARGLAIPLVGMSLTAVSWLPVWLDRELVAIPASDLLTNPRSIHYFRLGQVRLGYFGGVLDGLIHATIVQATILGTAAVAVAAGSSLAAGGIVLVASGLVLSTDWASPAYRSLAVLGHLQFPWRFLGLVGPGVGALVAAVFQASRRRRAVAIAVVVSTAGLGVAMVATARPFSEAARSIPAARALADYLPEGCNPPRDDQASPPSARVLPGDDGDRADPRILSWGPGHRSIAVDADGPSVVLIRTYPDPRWHAETQGGEPLPIRRWGGDSLGRIELRVPAGTTRVDLRFEPTGGARLGARVSLAAALLLLVAATASLGIRSLRARRAQPARPGGGDE